VKAQYTIWNWYINCFVTISFGDSQWKTKSAVKKNRREKSQRIMNHGISHTCKMGNQFVSNGGLKNEKNERRN
jgi:hypothetical protein